MPALKVSSLKVKFVLQFCFKMLRLPPYREVRLDPESDPEPKFPEKSGPDPKRIISDPQL